MSKVRVGTAWFDACAGCHMSVLDIDERILAVVDKIDIVYGPLVDAHEYPENVDVAIIEGAISSDHDEHLIKEIRSKSKFLIALGDCAVTSNVPGMRNQCTVKEILDRGYIENATAQQGHPSVDLPVLHTRARPVWLSAACGRYLFCACGITRGPGSGSHRKDTFRSIIL